MLEPMLKHTRLILFFLMKINVFSKYIKAEKLAGIEGSYQDNTIDCDLMVTLALRWSTLVRTMLKIILHSFG